MVAFLHRTLPRLKIQNWSTLEPRDQVTHPRSPRRRHLAINNELLHRRQALGRQAKCRPDRLGNFLECLNRRERSRQRLQLRAHALKHFRVGLVHARRLGTRRIAPRLGRVEVGRRKRRAHRARLVHELADRHARLAPAPVHQSRAQHDERRANEHAPSHRRALQRLGDRLPSRSPRNGNDRPPSRRALLRGNFLGRALGRTRPPATPCSARVLGHYASGDPSRWWSECPRAFRAASA